MTIISSGIVDGIVFVDQEHRVTLINAVAEQLLDIKAFLSIGQKIGGVVGGCDTELMRALDSKFDELADGVEVTLTTTLTLPSWASILGKVGDKWFLEMQLEKQQEASLQKLKIQVETNR